MVIKCGMPWITVSDMQKARSLFVDLLGGVIYDDNAEYRWLEIQFGDSFLGVFENPKKATTSFSFSNENYPGQNAVVSFVVDQAQEAHTKLNEHGFSTEPITSIPVVFNCFLFYDRDGNNLQIIKFI